MRRLLRWAFNLVALVSAVLFVGVCVLWVRSSGSTPAGAGWWTARLGGSRVIELSGAQIASERGGVALGALTRQIPSQNPPSLPREVGDWFAGTAPSIGLDLDYLISGSGRWGFDLVVIRPGPSFSGWLVCAPHWFLCLMTALPPASALAAIHGRRRRLAARRRASLCPSCGYDLRATPGRCPECGAVPGEAKPA